MDIVDRLNFIRIYDPDAAARIEKLLSRKDKLKGANVYGERFTERQFFLVFDPLMEAAMERVKILEVLSKGNGTIIHIAEVLHMDRWRVFNHIKELIRRDLVEIMGYDNRDPLYCIKR